MPIYYKIKKYHHDLTNEERKKKIGRLADQLYFRPATQSRTLA